MAIKVECLQLESADGKDQNSKECRQGQNVIRAGQI